MKYENKTGKTVLVRSGDKAMDIKPGQIVDVPDEIFKHLPVGPQKSEPAVEKPAFQKPARSIKKK